MNKYIDATGEKLNDIAGIRLYSKVMNRLPGSWDYITFKLCHPHAASVVAGIIDDELGIPETQLVRHYLPRNLFDYVVA